MCAWGDWVGGWPGGWGGGLHAVKRPCESLGCAGQTRIDWCAQPCHGCHQPACHHMCQGPLAPHLLLRRQLGVCCIQLPVQAPELCTRRLHLLQRLRSPHTPPEGSPGRSQALWNEISSHCAQMQTHRPTRRRKQSSEIGWSPPPSPPSTLSLSSTASAPPPPAVPRPPHPVPLLQCLCRRLLRIRQRARRQRIYARQLSLGRSQLLALACQGGALGIQVGTRLRGKGGGECV